MKTRENYNDIFLFMTVAEMGNFTQAAKRLDMAQSNISRAVSGLEERLGVRLIVRSTRKIALTQAGEMLYQHAKDGFASINHSLDFISNWKDNPSGVVRISAGPTIIDKTLLPRLHGFSQKYPHIRVELIADNHFINIIEEHFDAGVRLGSDVAEGMIATKLDDEMQMAVVASPDYWKKHGKPKTPQDLAQHSCIAYQFQAGGIYQWEFWDEKSGIYRHKPQGQWVFADDYSAIRAALNGWGVAFVPVNMVEEYLHNNQLVSVLERHSKPLPALYLYYPHRNISPAFRAVLEWLKNGA